MEIIRDFFYKMKISRFLFYLFILLFSVLNIKSVQSVEDVDIQTWAGFQGLNVVSVGAVADDCKKIFDSCRSDSQKQIDDLTKFIESTQDAAAVPPKLWDTLGRITDILQNAPKNVRFHFAELGDHFLKKLSSAISMAQSINFDKLQDLQSIYDSGVDPTNELVLELEKSFSVNYNPNSILQQTLPKSLNQASYSQSVALYELKHLSTAVTDEIDNTEKAALQLLNKIYKGIIMTKEILFSLKKTGTYPMKYDEQYIKDILQNCSFLAKVLKPGNPVSQPVSTNPPEPYSDGDPVIPSLCDDTPGGDHSGCGEIFRKTEKKIVQQLIVTIREIEPINDRKEIDSRIFEVFKNYSLVLSNLNKKIITNVITVVNQFFQLYNIVLSILDKINPDMKKNAEDLLYLQYVDTSDANYENINKYIVEDYLSSSKMNELLERVDVRIKSMKSLEEIKKGVKQELTVITTELGVDLQTFKSTIIHVFEELKNGVKSLQNLKNKSNRTGYRYYLNFYRGKADLAQLRKLIFLINSLKIELLLERQLFTDDEELQAFKDATTDVQNEIDQRNQKLMNELNSMNDFNFVQGFVSRSILDYNLCLESYTVESRTILKKVIKKYVTIFEELIIIIKRRKIKNAKTIEDLYLDQSLISTNQDATVKKYLLEKRDINVEKLCTTLNQSINTQNKEIIIQEISELNSVTHSEVTKINQTILKLINTMSTEIQNLKAIKDEASQTVDYEISEDKMKCISNIIQIIESLQIKSNKEEIQSLSIYFERVKENIQMASQNFETQTSECAEIQQFKSQVETLKISIFDSLTKASLEINEKIRRVLFEYNEKLFILRQNPSFGELNSLQWQNSTYTLKDYTRKYITGYYTSDDIFTALDTIMSSSSSSDISKVKTQMYAKLDETNQNIESELEKIHDDLNYFVEKFSGGMTVLTDMENNLQKQTGQSVTIDAAHLSTLMEVDGMVNVIGKYVNVNAESSQREVRVQIDNARLQISKQFEQVSQIVTSTQDYKQMESIMTQSINSCETIYNKLKNNTRFELTNSVEEFLNSYQKTVTTLHSEVSSSNSQTTILQYLNEGDCKTDDSEFQNFMQLMIEQDYQSSTTVSNTFEYMKKYNFVDSKSIKEKCAQVFQSLSNKMNMEIEKISRVSKYVLQNVQKANNVLIKLENCEHKQSIDLSLTDEELREFHMARSVNELWKYSSQDTTISSISTTIVKARSEIDLEYRKIQTNLECSTDRSVVQIEIQTSLQNIENIFQTTQTQVNEIVKRDVESFYSSMTKEINELQYSGSSTLNTALQSVVSNRIVSTSDQQQNSSTNYDFNSFTSSINIQQIYNEIKTKTTQNSSQTIESFKQVINEKFSKVEKTSVYVVENVQKGYSVMEEIKSSLQLDSNYQLTQYQEEQLKKCVTVSHKVGNLKVDAETAQVTITNNINSVKYQISEEYTKISESVSSLTDEKSIQVTVSNGINKFEQLYVQAKDTVKEQLSLAFSGFYSSYMNSIKNLEHQSSSQICKTMRDIETDVSSYQSSSDQSFIDTVSYFNRKSFKSCLSVKNWFHSIQSTTSVETFSTVNEKCTKELSSLNDNITTSFDKMESSSTYVLQSIEKSSELLTSIEESVKQDATYQLTEEQITEFQKCISIYKSIQTVTTTSTLNAQELIQTNIRDMKNKVNSECAEISQSISSCTDEISVKEVTTKGVHKFEKIFSQAKESVKEELSQSFNSFYNSFTQITTDSKSEFNQISSTLQSIKSNTNTYQSDDQSYQETVSYFHSDVFKSCLTVKNWFNKISTSSSSTTSSNIQEKTMNEFKGVNEEIHSSLDQLKTSSSFILQTIESSTQIFKEIETSMIQGSTYELRQEQITQLQKCMSIYQSVHSTVTSTSTFITQQKIQADMTNVKEELTSEYSQITQSISSCSDDHSIRQVETKGVDNYQQIFSHATETIKQQLTQKTSDLYSMFAQLSTDMKNENRQQSVVTSENISQFETDESFINMTSCFTSMFKSTSVIKNWYSEIKKTTSESDWGLLSGGLSGKVTSDFGKLNEKVTKSIDLMQESSTYVLDTMKTGFDTIKQVNACMMQDSNYKLTQEQVTCLQKCVAIHQTIQKVMTTTSTSVTNEAKQTMESDISNMKSLINEEFNKASETIRSLTDETSINEAATKSVDNMDKFFSETKGKVQSVLSDSSSTFYGTYQKVSSVFEKQENNQIKQVLSDIVTNKNSYQCQNDQSFSNVISYFSDSSYKSSSVIHNWYNEIKSSSSTNQSSSFSENTISKLKNLNERVTKSITSMEEYSSSIIDTIEKGSEVLKQIEESTNKNSSYQLSQDQVTYLQKSITIYQTIQSIPSTTSSATVSKAKQNISSDISNVKNKITDEYVKVSETLNSLSDETGIKQTVNDHVSKVDHCYSETKQKVQIELNQATTDFFNNYQQISSCLNKEDVSILQDIVSGKNTYQATSDETYSKMTSYLNSDTFKSNCSVQNWYNEIHSSSSSTTQSSTNECAIKELGTLNDRVTKSIDSMEECSNYVLDTIDKGSAVIKQIEQLTKENTDYHLSQIQITELQKTFTIHQTVQSITTTTTSTTVSTSKQAIALDISNAKSKITDEYAKVSESLKSLTDENSIRQIVDDNVSKVDQCFSETKQKVQTELNHASADFYNNYQQISSCLNKEDVSALQDIISGKNTYQATSDETYSKMASYLNSDTFKSNCSVQNWYNEIHSSSSSTTQSSTNECAIKELGTLNDRVTKSIDSMEECSNYVLDTIDKGSAVIKQIQQLTKENTDYHLSQIQITELQKTFTIHQTIQSITTTTTSTTVSTSKQAIASDINNAKNKITDEYAKVSESLKSLTDENSIRQIVDDNVSKVDQCFSETKQKVQNELNHASADFFNNYQQISSCLNKEDVSALQDIISGKNTYQATSDETYSKMASYLNSDTFKSNCSVQNWYIEIHSPSSSTTQSSTNECAIKELGTLNDRVTKSIDSMEECSNYVLDTIDKGSAVIKQIQQLTKENTDYHLSQIQITELQKTFTIHQTIQSITTTTTSTTVSTSKQAIASDISNAKSKITDEYAKVSESLKSLTDENSIRQIVDDNVSKVDQCFSETKQKVQNELNHASADFFNNYQQISSCLNKEDVSALQDIISGQNTYQATSDETYSKMASYLNSDTFKSNCSVQNWYNKIHSSSSSTTQSSTNECAIKELGTLNDRVTKSIDSMEECSNYVLDTIDKGSAVIKQIQQLTKENTDYHLSQIQITELQKTFTIHQTIQSITTTTTSTTVSTSKQAITSDISNAKSKITDEYAKVSESLKSLTDENSIRQIVDDNVSKVDQCFSETKQKVQTELNHASADFYNNYQQISLCLNKEDVSALQDIISGKNTYQATSDESYSKMASYLNSDTFKSNCSVQNWYNEIHSSSSSTTQSSTNECAIKELGTLNDRVTKSIDSMEECSNYVLDTIDNGSAVIKQIEQLTKENTDYHLSQIQITELQETFTIHQTIQSITTTTTSTTVSTSKQAIASDISNAKSKITDEYAKVSESLKSLTDENSIRQIVDDNVSKVDQCFSETKQKVQNELNHASADFFNNYQQISSCLNKEDVSALQDIISGQNTYQATSDETYSKMASYLNSDTFKSNCSVQNWYNKIHSSSSSTTQSSTNECAIKELGTLNDRVTKSIDSMEECSNYVLDTIDKGSAVIKQIQQLTKENTDYHLSQIQITELQKTFTIHQTIQSITTTTTSTTVSTSKQAIASDISNAKSKITDEYAKVSESLKSLTDENSIRQIVDDNVSKVDQCFSETKQKVQTELNHASADFYNNYQQISLCLNKEDVSALQDIISGKNTYQVTSDETYSKMASYLNSDTFKSNCSVQNWYNEIHSSCSSTTQSSTNECAIKELGTLNDRVTKSIDSMEECSNYVLDTIDKGSAVIKQIEQLTKENTDYHLSQIQITELQKTFTIHQTIQSITTTTTSTTVSTSKQAITSDISNAKSKITDEYAKVSESLKSLTDENSIRQIVDDNVSKVDQCFSETKQKVQTELNHASADFFNNYQQISSCLNKEDVSALQDIILGKNTYQATSDETYSKMVSYLNSDTFKSNCSVQNLYNEIHSSSSSTTQSSTNECAIKELGTLNDRVTKSIDSMGECSNYVLDTFNKGSEVIKQIQQSTKENTDYHLSQLQITELQKTISIQQIVQSITITNKSTTTSNAEITITLEVSKVKNQINEESTKVAESIRSLSDESSIKKAVDDHVSKVEQYYGQVKDKVQTQLTNTSSNFFSGLQTCSSTLNTQTKSETNTVIQDIVNGKNTYQVDNDQSFKNVVTYLNSDSFKSNKMVQNIYQTIQSDTSTSKSTNYSEQAVNNLNTFSNNVSKSVDFMEENSKYMLDTMNKASEVIQQIEEYTKKDVNYKITQDQITILQKCIMIYQTIQTITTTTTTTSTTSGVSKDEIISNTDQNVNQTSGTSQNVVASNVGRSIPDNVDLHDENKNGKTQNSIKIESTAANDKTADSTKSSASKPQQSSADAVGKTQDLNNKESTAANDETADSTNQSSASKPQQSSAGVVSKVNNEGNAEICDSASITHTQEKITINVGNAKSQINDKFAKTSQSINSMSDETSIRQVVNDNVQKVDKYYSEAKKEVQTQLTQTTSSFYKSCQKISENTSSQNSQSNSILREIVNDKSTYQADNDGNFIEILTYLNSDSFKSSMEVQDWYKEIHSDTNTSDFRKQSVDELNNLNSRVTKSVDMMEIRSKDILTTLKQGSEILKQIEDSSKRNTNYELSQDQIIVLKKCITIYQVIETITTTTTTVTKTVAEKNNSVSDHSVTSDDEYEYEIETKQNTREIVQVEETTDSASHDLVNNQANNKETKSQNGQVVSTGTNTTQKAAENSSSQNVQLAATNASLQNDVKSGANSATNENTVSKRNEKKANKIYKLKQFTKEDNTYSKTSLTTLMVNWKITKSTTPGVPNTCASLRWEKYFKPDDDESIIKDIADLLVVGRSVIEDSIELKKEKLALYRDVDDIEMMITQSTDIVNEVLLQLSEVVGQDVQTLKQSFSVSMNKNLGSDASAVLSDKTTTLDKELLCAASTFFSLRDSKKTDLLNQINKQFNNVQIEDEKQAREIATKQFDKLQSIMNTVYDNIDCLVLRVVDTIETAKHSISCAKNDENCSIHVKNGQVLCDTVKIPVS